MFVYATIISSEELNRTFEGYRSQIEAIGTNGNQLQCLEDAVTSHEKHYGLSFVEYLRSNLDLTKVDLGGTSIS
jgi:hypothetical protein